MRTQNKFYLFVVPFIFILSGCVVRTYPVTRDRVDQDLTGGNKGYLKGQAPESTEVKERKATRTTQVVEVELYSPIKFEKMPKAKMPEKTEDEELWGNRGYITKSETSVITAVTTTPNVKEYKVQRGDTLQKISEKFYGTTKRWIKIYEANKDVLKGPNKIYPGQVLNIPIESLKETQENLK